MRVTIGVVCVGIGVLAASARVASAQSETIFTGVGADTRLVFPHTSIAGATGIDFSLFGGIAPVFPTGESHTLITVFEWGPTASGPWFFSPDNVNTIEGGHTNFISTGIFSAPADAPFVAVHFYAGGLMTISGTFSHTSVPTPASAVLLLLGLATAARRRR